MKHYFARFGEKGFGRGVSVFLTVSAALILGYLVVRYRYFTYIVKEEFFTTPFFFDFLAVYIASALLCIPLYFSLRNRHALLCAACVFCLALIPRLLIGFLFEYVPQNDFANYFKMGQAFCAGDYRTILQTAQGYQISDFLGTGVLFGWIGKLFTPTVHGYLIANSVMTSCICVLVYAITRTFHTKAALLSAFLFALYPANISMVHMTNNQHPAVLFLMLSLYLVISAVSAKHLWTTILLGCASGLSLLISQFAHPSTVTTVIAVSLYLIVLFIGAMKQKRALLKTVCLMAAFLGCYFGGRIPAHMYFDSLGILSKEQMPATCYLSKVVVGLNPETYGAYSADDYGMIASLPAQEQNATCIRIIRERLASNSDLLDFFDTKLLRTWIVKDTAFGWPLYGIWDQIQTEAESIDSPLRNQMRDRINRVTQAYQLLDFFYVAMLLLFALIGILMRSRGPSDLFVWTLLGWIGVLLLTEIQTRYRYPAMPIICMFAGVGIFGLCSALGRIPFRKQKGFALNTPAGAVLDAEGLDAENSPV